MKTRTPSTSRALPTLLLLLVAAAACDQTDAAAELGSRSISVDLRYLDGESNAGPTDATGTATIDTTTGRVEIVVMGLPDTDGDAYEGWLAGGGEAPISTGVFHTDESGAGASEITLGDLSARSYTKVVITIEPDPDPDPAPDARHSLAGFID